MKEKMLMKLERDRLASRVASLEAQMRQLEGARPAEDAMQATQPPSGPKKPRGATLPPDSRDNPHLEREYAPANVARWGLAKTFQAHSASVSALAMHPTKPIVATASDDGLWKMWSLTGGDLIMSGDGHKGWLSGIDFSPAGRQLATCAEDGTLKIWDFEKSRCVQTLVEHTQAVWGLAYMTDCPEFIVSKRAALRLPLRALAVFLQPPSPPSLPSSSTSTTCSPLAPHPSPFTLALPCRRRAPWITPPSSGT